MLMRELVEEERYRRDREALHPNAELWDTVLRAALWRIASESECGESTNDPDIHSITTDSPGDYRVVIDYRVVRQRVHLLSVQRASAD